jgi:hypothetical protein
MSSLSHKEPRRRPRLATALSLAAIGVLWLLAATPALAAINEFTINVPHKALPKLQIQKLRVTVTVVNGAVNNTFRITPPANSPGNVTQDVVMNKMTDLQVVPPFAGPGGLPADIVTAFPDPNDTTGNKFVFVFNLNSDYDSGNFCVDKMDTPETWKIRTTGGNLITGMCVQSIDQPGCTNDLRTVPLSEEIATVTMGGMPVPTSLQGCRPPVDVVLVLDRSGSMSGSVTAMDLTTKMNRLHSAVKAFMDQWNTLKLNETDMSASPQIGSVQDRVGVVLFDSTMPAQWLGQVVAGSNINGLTSYLDPDKTATGGAANATFQDIKTHIDSVAPNSGTSIGSGLLLADSVFTLHGGSARKVILLMSDGMENTYPESGPVGNQAGTYATMGAVFNPLQNQIPPLAAGEVPTRIYAITVGSGAGIVDAAVNSGLAIATNGDYKNTETDSALLPVFFLETLQNFLKASTVETFRLASGQAQIGTPYQATIPVTSTTQSITFTVTWNPRMGPVKATVTPPGGAPIVKTDQSGTLIVNSMLPVSPAQSSAGNWDIKIEPVSQIGALGLPQIGSVPINLIVMGDDTSLGTNMAPVASAEYTPGDTIKLRARITELDKPLTGLNSQPGAKVLVRLVSPGASVGDILSDSTVQPGPPQPGDTQSAASAKLEAILSKDPNALTPTEGTLQMFDDGSAAHGDDKANDGIYSAVFPAQQVGHYNFIFALEGATTRLGRFSRQHMQTIYVRAVPDASATQFQSSVSGNTLSVVMTPKTKTGHRMGPGFANYFWFTAPGISPVKPVDNMNGTYTATINFTGSTPPSPVEFHFEHDLVRLPDSVTADQLPTPLGPGNVVVSHVPVPGGNSGGGFKHWGISLHAGVSIPHGSFSNFLDPGPDVGFDVEYRFNPVFSLEGIYTYHRFRGQSFGTFHFSDVSLHQLSLNGKVYGGTATSPVRPFFNFGGGAYVFASGTVHPGLNVGGGLQFTVTPTFAVDSMYNFNNVFTSGTNLRFSTVQGGVRFRF